MNITTFLLYAIFLKIVECRYLRSEANCPPVAKDGWYYNPDCAKNTTITYDRHPTK